MSAASAPTVPTVPTFEQHGLKKHSDGDWANRAPVQTRSARPKSTSVDDFAAVTGREVEWRYSPVAKLTDLPAGDLDGSPYEYSSTTVDGVPAAWVSRD